MKPTYYLLSALLLSSSLHAATARVEDVNNTLFTLSGTTTTVEGNNATMPGINKWASTEVTGGTDFTGTTLATPTSTDFFFTFAAPALTGITVASNRYVEIHYSTTGSWVGADTTHFLFLNSTDQPAEFVTFQNRGPIPNGSENGSHSIIIDLDVNGDWSGTWNTLRWDFFNIPVGDAALQGGGKTFTIDKLVFANSVNAVPEPSAALLGGLGILGLLRRRRQG